MQDSVLFLGTGGDSLVVGKQIRASGGIVLNISGNQFLLDPGPGCLARMRQAGISVRDTIAVLVSHNHTNHSSELNAVLEAMSVSGLDRIGVLVSNNKVINGDDQEHPVLKKRSKDFVEKILTLEPGRKIGINNVNITTAKTKHYDSQGLGFIFETNKYRIAYTSDTEFTKEIAEQYKDCGLLILNCKYPDELESKGHLNSSQAAEFLKLAKPKLAVINHFGIKMIEANPLYEAREIQKLAKVEVAEAKDGLEINPASYASGVRQISLDNFKK